MYWYFNCYFLCGGGGVGGGSRISFERLAHDRTISVYNNIIHKHAEGSEKGMARRESTLNAGRDGGSVASRDSFSFSEFSDFFEACSRPEVDAAAQLESYLEGCPPPPVEPPPQPPPPLLCTVVDIPAAISTDNSRLSYFCVLLKIFSSSSFSSSSFSSSSFSSSSSSSSSPPLAAPTDTNTGIRHHRHGRLQVEFLKSQYCRQIHPVSLILSRIYSSTSTVNTRRKHRSSAPTKSSSSSSHLNKILCPPSTKTPPHKQGSLVSRSCNSPRGWGWGAH
jgi:hypothetical protein